MPSDIVVTTPKSQKLTAEQEALESIEAGGGEYFRNLGARRPRQPVVGGRCFYVEDGAVRGFCIITGISEYSEMRCDTSGREFGAGVYVFMDAATWKWLEPIPHVQGFQGWRYSWLEEKDIVILGSWLDPRPS